MCTTGLVAEAAPGCVVLDARRDTDECGGWALSVEAFDEKNFGAAAYHISLTGIQAFGRAGPLPRSASGCTTLALALPARTQLDACELEGSVGRETIASDVVDLVEPPEPPLRAPSSSYYFPLAGPARFLCTQAAGGMLSHFVHASVYHAVDFRCDVGTTVVAVGAGTVETVETANVDSSIHVSALFKWNRVVVALDDGAIAEYVHVAPNSEVVRVGDRVAEGQPICGSGDVGFCPEPHLHLELHLDRAEAAPSVPFALRRLDGTSAVPRAGEWWAAPPPLTNPPPPTVP
ncbi:hypothetical protein CTAYLR_002421 [Chrysophaeum taylorii]|uniref:M23ase beta-sheet core domain-containing protein n=1 Tax=Chrysophaeum taylorii TaxID=2483200 RepID=A0AAD7UM00_9STRA|nr:hypothetical protein CTAYLR_002421 [Chrysophaeum taylorii]